MTACLECLIESHELCECPLPVDGALICCCPPESLQEVAEPNKRGGPIKDPDEITDPKSTGRKRAAQLYPIEEGMICEWARLKQAGGGVFPIIGCLGNKASDRHHGPDKNTLNNSSGNVHRICDHCHNRWHALNDPVYPGERPAGDTPFVPEDKEWFPHDAETEATEKEIVANEIEWYTKKKEKKNGREVAKVSARNEGDSESDNSD